MRTDFTKIENCIASLRDDFFSKDSQDYSEVSSFLNAGEYGIALETICFALIEENVSISMEKKNKIKELGKIMEMEDSVWIPIAVHPNLSSD